MLTGLWLWYAFKYLKSTLLQHNFSCRPNAFEIRSQEGKPSAVVHCDDASMLSEWIKYISSNIMQLTAQQVIFWYFGSIYLIVTVGTDYAFFCDLIDWLWSPSPPKEESCSVFKWYWRKQHYLSADFATSGNIQCTKHFVLHDLDLNSAPKYLRYFKIITQYSIFEFWIFIK